MRGPELAIDVPATKRSLRRRWIVALIPAVAAVALLVLAASAYFEQRSSKELQRHGAPADATIVAVKAKPTGRGKVPNGSLVVRFDAAGQTLERSIHVGRSVVDYQTGQHVKIVYDPSHPTRVELLGQSTAANAVPPLAALIGAALFASMAVVAGRHVCQISGVVRREPWQIVRTQLVQVPQSFGFRRGSRTLVVLDTPSGPLTVEPIGLARVDPAFTPEAWIAGLGIDTAVGQNAMVLAAPGGAHLVPVRAR
jgi:hypothetical protein